jgi:hypothetical protein
VDAPPSLTAALELAGFGWHVHPLCWPVEGLCGCGRGHVGRDVGKAPVTAHGWKDATVDPDEIRALWEPRPRANVGVALKPSELILIDPDSEEAQAETVELGRPPTTLRVSRNNAFIYERPDRCPTELALKKGRTGKLDVLSLGYAVAYGLHQTGVPVYVDWLGGPAPAPGWVVKILFERQRERLEKRSKDDTRPPGQPVGIEDAELLRRMFEAKNGPDIRKLWLGDWEEDPRWPSWSEADQALCNHLAWWTRRDAARIDRLFRASGLMREKWGGSYAKSTIDKAIAWAPHGYGEEDPKAPRLMVKNRKRRPVAVLTGAVVPSAGIAPTVWKESRPDPCWHCGRRARPGPEACPDCACPMCPDCEACSRECLAAWTSP